MTCCPRCGSSEIRGAHFDFDTAGLREFGCLACGLIEDCRTDAPDYAAWLSRWMPSDDQPPTQEPDSD